MISNDMQIIFFPTRLSFNLPGHIYSSVQRGLRVPSYTAQFPNYWETETLKSLLFLLFQVQKFGRAITVIREYILGANTLSAP